MLFYLFYEVVQKISNFNSVLTICIVYKNKLILFNEVGMYNS